MRRREFLKLTSMGLVAGVATPEVVLAAEAALGAVDDEALVRKSGFSILQGLTTADSTQLTVDVPKHMTVQYRLVDCDTGAEMPTYYQIAEVRDYSGWRVDKLGYEGLRYPGRYAFQVLDQFGVLLDERFVKTLDLARTDVRIGLVSCMLDWSFTKGAMWEAVRKNKPDILFFLGDNVYGDLGLKQGPKLLWTRYIETRRRLPFYHFKELIPVVATWDDHDFGLNDAGGKYRHKVNSAETFHAFFAQEPRFGVLSAGPGIASVFYAFGQQFVFADNRTYRRLPSLNGKAFWGDEQMQWVFRQLQPEAGPVWILQGTQTFGANNGKKTESYENAFEGEFDELRRNLRALNVPVIFVSGDIHFSEIMQLGPSYLGFPTYELTSSSMHSFLPMTRSKNPRRTHAIWRENAFMVDLDGTDPSRIALRLTAIGYHNKLFFKEDIFVG